MSGFSPEPRNDAAPVLSLEEKIKAFNLKLDELSFKGETVEELLAIARQTHVGNFNDIDDTWEIVDPTTKKSAKLGDLLVQATEHRKQGLVSEAYFNFIEEINKILKAREELRARGIPLYGESETK